MKTDLHPFYVRKKVRDVICAEGGEWTRTVKITQFFVPRLRPASPAAWPKVVLVLLLLAAALLFTDKIKEVAPFVVSVLEQLR